MMMTRLNRLLDDIYLVVDSKKKDHCQCNQDKHVSKEKGDGIRVLEFHQQDQSGCSVDMHFSSWQTVLHKKGGTHGQ